MTDLDLLVVGALVTFLAVAGAYIAIRHRANEDPVDSYAPGVSTSQSRQTAQPQIVQAQQGSTHRAN